MWDDAKRRRYDDLRNREATGSLTGPEGAELQGLFAELDAQEEAALSDALRQSERRRQELRAENQRLAREVEQLERIRDEYRGLLDESRALSGRGSRPADLTWPEDEARTTRVVR